MYGDQVLRFAVATQYCFASVDPLRVAATANADGKIFSADIWFQTAQHIQEPQLHSVTSLRARRHNRNAFISQHVD